jgi:inorganic triphosphatase YgiF
MQVEIEMKLELDTASLDRLRRHPVIRQYRQGRATTQTLDNTYYDSQDFALAKAKAALRIRKKGRQYIQTLKAQGAQNGVHFERPEWEWDRPTPTLDMALMDETPIAAMIKDPRRAAEIQPLFATNFKRTTWVLADTDWEIELTIDQGEVCAGPAAAPLTAPIQEVELELKRGEPVHLYDLARKLTQDLPCRLSLVSKAGRGYGLIRGDRQQPTKGTFPTLTANTSLAEAFRAICLSCLTHALENEPVLREQRHPEAVHQMRVGLRRLRSALSLFKSIANTPEGVVLKEELRWLAGELGDARDLDVFKAELLAPVLDAYPTDSALTLLAQTINHHQNSAYDRALAALDNPRCGRLFLDFAAWLDQGDWCQPLSAAQRLLLDQPVKGFAQGILEHRARVVERGGRRLQRMGAEKRHALRIEIKKLRYACEFFVSLYGPKKAKPYMKALAALQDQFGALNDAAVAHSRLFRLASGDSPTHGVPLGVLAFAGGLVSGWHQHRAHQDMAHCLEGWKDFADQRAFW